MNVHVFVDESKERGYYLAAAVVLTSGLVDARKAMRSLILPRQPRVHFVKESNARRRQILDVIEGLGAEIILYDASGQPDEKKARSACLVQLVDDLAARNACMLVLERDDSVLAHDQRLLYQQVRIAGCADTLTYRHERARSNPLLAIPDAIVWCWSRGRDWRSRANQIITDIRNV